MLCHKCPHFDAVERGEYDSKPWHDTPCAQCRLGEDTYYSIPYDEEHPSGVAGLWPSMSAFSTRTAEGCSVLSFAELMPVATIASCIQGLLSLEPELRDIVAWRFQGVTYREIGQRQGTSTQLAEMRHKRAIREWPALASLFPEKIAKQVRRKSKA